MACARVTHDIDERIQHIALQVSLGTSQVEVVTEQYHQLLRTFSRLIDMDLTGINRISKHLVETHVFSKSQLLAFSVSLRTASANRKNKGNNRSMQNNSEAAPPHSWPYITRVALAWVISSLGHIQPTTLSRTVRIEFRFNITKAIAYASSFSFP
jgi:hypothetical protein